MLSRLSLSLASIVVAGCIEERTIDLSADDPIVARAEAFEIPQVSPPPLDLLIVVDNGPAMARLEERLAPELPGLGVLLEQNRGWWDRHIGVVTADVGCTERPAWRPAALTNDRFFIDWRHLDGTRTKNFEGTLEDHLPATLAAGHEGCGANRPLDALLAALDPATGFRRPDADLIVVVIAASDDQSLVDVDTAYAEIVATSDQPADVLRTHLIVFAPEHAARLRAFATSGSAGRFGNVFVIDRDDLLTPFEGFGHSDLWGAPCFQSSNLDLDPATDGLQPSCTVTDLVRDAETGVTLYEKTLPACTGANRPCWRIEVRPNQCTITPYSLAIDRIDFPPRGTLAVGQCEIAETP